MTNNSKDNKDIKGVKGINKEKEVINKEAKEVFPSLLEIKD